MQIGILNRTTHGASLRAAREESARLPAEYHEMRWYAAYTSANHEKRVALQLVERSVEHFLPLYESLRRWKDRRMKLQCRYSPATFLCGWRCATDCRYCRYREWRGWWASTGCLARCPIQKSRRCKRAWSAKRISSRIRTCRLEGGCA